MQEEKTGEESEAQGFQIGINREGFREKYPLVLFSYPFFLIPLPPKIRHDFFT